MVFHKKSYNISPVIHQYNKIWEFIIFYILITTEDTKYFHDFVFSSYLHKVNFPYHYWNFGIRVIIKKVFYCKIYKNIVFTWGNVRQNIKICQYKLVCNAKKICCCINNQFYTFDYSLLKNTKLFPLLYRLYPKINRKAFQNDGRSLSARCICCWPN